MKKFHLLILLVAVTLFGCRTRSSYAPVSYKVAGLGTVTVTPNQPGQLMVDFTRILNYATNETLTLSLSGLPAGVDATITPTMGTLPFSSTIMISDINAMAGSYVVNLVVNSSMSGQQSYSFTLTISGGNNPGNCDITGMYGNATAACTANGSYNYAETVMYDSAAAMMNKVWFMNFANFGYSVYGFVDCSTNTISIPTQSLPNFLTVWGDGSFTSNDSSKAVIVSYSTMTLDSMVTNCQFTLIQ